MGQEGYTCTHNMCDSCVMLGCLISLTAPLDEPSDDEGLVTQLLIIVSPAAPIASSISLGIVAGKWARSAISDPVMRLYGPVPLPADALRLLPVSLPPDTFERNNWHCTTISLALRNCVFPSALNVELNTQMAMVTNTRFVARWKTISQNVRPPWTGALRLSTL
eukprot:4565930-Amphidinium_carterae.2